VLVCVNTRDAQLRVNSSSRPSNIVVLLFCLCVTRGILSLFAIAVLLLLLCAERLFARAWYRCVSGCDVRERRCLAGLSSGMTASGTCGAVWLCRFGGHSHTVVRER
jgi:hypothetical protein